ncbi:MAG TPA: hypothetical protein VLH15_10620, partial [Dehalococcoidales bacterium]|nr:hypothetical protein [Dehalococcoidales bacterium]
MPAKFWKRDNPALYEINTTAWLWELSEKYGKNLTLGQVPGVEWDRLNSCGMDFIWLMGIWKRSPRSRQIGLASRWLRQDFEAAFPGYREEDVIGS